MDNYSEKPKTASFWRYGNTVKIFLAVFFVFGIAALFPIGTPERVTFPVGSVWNGEDVIANFAFPIYRPEGEYRAAVESCKAAVLPRYDDAPRAASNSVQKFGLYWNAVTIWAISGDTKADSLPVLQELIKNNAALKDSISAMPPTIARRLFKIAEDTSFAILRSALSNGIINDSKDTIRQRAIMIRGEHSEIARSIDSVQDATHTLMRLRAALSAGEIPNYMEMAAVQILAASMEPTLLFNARETEQDRESAAASVPRSTGIVERGERIAMKGQRIDAETLAKLDAYQMAQTVRGENNTISKYFGAVFYMLLFGILIAFYLFSLRKRLLADNQQLTLILLILLFESALAFLSMRFGNIFPVEYLIVVPTAAMLCTILFDSRTGFFFAVVAALLVAGIRGGDYSFGLAALVAGGMAAFTVRDLRSRTQLFRSIGYIFLGYVITVASTALGRSDPLARVWQEIAFAGVNAVVSPVFTYALLIAFEKTFRLTSDLTLLEFDNINHPLLKELSTNAPGTFHHTMVIADMAERAANAIGANATLAKVGAYYHDIGKILKPDFFVENQLDKRNKHERLSPLNSAQIIAQHVHDGIRLGREYKLPQKIVDFIPMHHGTTVIAYFYDRALRRRRREEVKIDDYRYPGPKPHSKETAIVMLADSVEATVRSVQTLDESAIESTVERTIKNRFLEGQLDECDLTAGEMKIVQDQFVEILAGIHHPRIEYPGQPNQEPDASAVMEPLQQEAPPPDAPAPTEQPISPETDNTASANENPI